MRQSALLVSKLFFLFFGTTLLVVMSEGFTIPTKRGPNAGTAVISSGSHCKLTKRCPLPSQATSLASTLASTTVNTATFPRGGGGTGSSSALAASTSDNNSNNEDAMSRQKTDCPVTTPFAIFGSIWGSLGVIYILAKAIKRVTPIALEPFGTASTLTLTPFQWSMYALNCIFFAYAEGYKGFQLKFSPLVVKRSFTLIIGTPQGNNPINFLLAPLYSMGLINATKKRMITSWCVSLGVAAIVAAVKQLPPVWRCIMDAGVVVGLSWGTISILYFYIKSIITGKTPNVDACLPAITKKK